MTDPLPSIDLRLTPDWLKESEPGNRYADYEGDQSQDRYGRGQGNRRDNRPRHLSQPNNRQRPNQNDRRSGGQYQRDNAGNRNFRGDRSHFQRRGEVPLRPEVEPAPVQIDFLPEERALSKIIQQIKQGHVAYPLFGLAHMFLERPERHRIRVRSLDNQTLIYQFGDAGPIAMDLLVLDQIAFMAKKDEFYETQIVEKEPIKGNFSSVARCTLSGRLLGPTNHHAFQSVIRSLYEQRFSRRMSFKDYRQTIEISSDPAIVEQWKEKARKVVTFQTKDQENPIAFENIAAVEQHFRTHYLPGLIKPCLATELSGETARQLPDRGIIAAICKARDRENRFPAQIAGVLRQGLNHAGLQVFKHKKRILYISTVRPQLFNLSHSSVSTNLSAILSTIRSFPKISRKQLAEKVLSKLLETSGKDETSPEYQQAKTMLASDLIWLAKAGHVIEFSDGSLDLPLPPKPIESAKEDAEETTKSKAHDSAYTLESAEPVSEVSKESSDVSVEPETAKETMASEFSETASVASSEMVSEAIAQRNKKEEVAECEPAETQVG